MAQSGDISQIKFATGGDADDGDYSTPLVAAVSGKKIRVLAFSASVLTAGGSVTVKGTGGSTLYQMTLAVGTPFAASTGSPYVGLFETASGEGVLPSNGTNVDSFCNCTYVELTP